MLVVLYLQLRWTHRIVVQSRTTWRPAEAATHLVLFSPVYWRLPLGLRTLASPSVSQRFPVDPAALDRAGFWMVIEPFPYRDAIVA